MSQLRRNWRRLVLVVLAIVALPYVLILLYTVEFVRPVSTLMLRDLALLRGYDRQWVDFDDISPNLVQAVMMSEDGQFCRHGGVDWGEMRAVVNEALAGEQTRGASTIPMQTAKNLFLWNGRSFVRKGLELYLALWLELLLSKERILDLYLNLAEWGPNDFGAEAAARVHFRKSAAALTRDEAARLAAILPSPRRWSPRGSIASQRAAVILGRMAYAAPREEPPAPAKRRSTR